MGNLWDELNYEQKEYFVADGGGGAVGGLGAANVFNHPGAFIGAQPTGVGEQTYKDLQRGESTSAVSFWGRVGHHLGSLEVAFSQKHQDPIGQARGGIAQQEWSQHAENFEKGRGWQIPFSTYDQLSIFDDVHWRNFVSQIQVPGIRHGAENLYQTHGVFTPGGTDPTDVPLKKDRRPYEDFSGDGSFTHELHMNKLWDFTYDAMMGKWRETERQRRKFPAA